MSDHMVFQNCSAGDKEAIRAYWRQKVPRIERLLARFPEDQRELRLTVTYKSGRYDVHAVLLLPTGSLVAEASTPTGREAVDAVVDKLVAELRRHKELIRHEDLYRKKQERREASQRVAVLARPKARKPDKAAFFDLLNPLMARLRDHARHEVTVAELQGRIGREQITVADLLDEAILRAWDRFDRKDESEPFEVWLTRLLHEVLDEQIGKVRKARSLEERVDSDVSDGEGVAGAAAEEAPGWEEPVPLMFEDVLPNHEVGEPWQAMEAVDQMKWVLAQLSTVSALQRRAFTMHLLDGWEPDEIAMVQNRSVAEVRDDIEAVRRMLRDRLEAESQTPLPESPASRGTQ